MTNKRFSSRLRQLGKMVWTAGQKRLKRLEAKARDVLCLLKANEVAAKDHVLQTATAWNAANPLKRKANTTAKDGKVPFMLPSPTS